MLDGAAPDPAAELLAIGAEADGDGIARPHAHLGIGDNGRRPEAHQARARSGWGSVVTALRSSCSSSDVSVGGSFEFGPWQTIWKRHRRYAGDVTWDRVPQSLIAHADAAVLVSWDVSVDATIARAHQHATNPTRPDQDTGGFVELQESTQSLTSVIDWLTDVSRRCAGTPPRSLL